MFCNKCGVELVGVGGFCARCGAATGEVPPAIAAAPQMPRVQSRGLSGIGGWLLFFCFYYLLFRPLTLIPYMRTFRIDSLYTYFVLAETAFGMIVALLLWMRRSEVFPYLRAFLVLEVALIVTRLVRILSSRPLSTFVRVSFVVLFGAIALIPVAWYGYFHTSVRIRNTYGRNI